MQRALNLARGVVRVQVICRYPERFINLCASNDIGFWGMEQLDTGELRAFFTGADFRTLRELSGRNGFEVTRIKKSGAPVLMKKLRKRYILVAGLLFTILVTRMTSLFVWDIRVAGNETVPRTEIMENLKALGFTYGTFGMSVHSEQLSEEMKLRIPELSWLAVNIRGSRADVLVRERIPKPEIPDRKTPAMVIAKKSGVITKMSVLEGAPQVKTGATVEAGELLVSGILDSRARGQRFVHAMAEVEARTWYELSAQMPVETVVKRYTGERKSKNAIIFAGKRINFFLNSSISWSNYDKIISERNAALPMGVSLPITLVRETYNRYEPITTEQSRERAELTLKQGLELRLRDAIGDGTVSAVAWDASETNGVITVTLFAECVEQIAVSVPIK
ncbi:MAG: sporulation protein YqfD [Oscillospiraceae bacterium]|jgi:similar to stage IV sporulation protein|nr:sporulation protein YqfD [Oscillospiraceae bacterium]